MKVVIDDTFRDFEFDNGEEWNVHSDFMMLHILRELLTLSQYNNYIGREARKFNVTTKRFLAGKNEFENQKRIFKL